MYWVVVVDGRTRTAGGGGRELPWRGVAACSRNKAAGAISRPVTRAASLSGAGRWGSAVRGGVIRGWLAGHCLTGGIRIQGAIS
ncbi:hypothetical protein PR202_gb05102 [Eleusine coracana subsp. coracana]|uniref:Uncharacterized protein n=1 Tax=Eleusine coracana subsp. coracana TaxID=191504 RepID=A0AAV5E627_ELECO|nr:hypothetical protein PR202_gb05102 [Eleusine coracana subsp. coracana]